MWLALNLIMNRSNRAAKGSVHCHCKSVRACTSNWALSSEHLERLRVSQCCYCCAKTFLKLRISFDFRLWATQRESVINCFQKSVCLVTCPIHIGQNRCSSSKGILESSVRNILVKNWLSRCVSRICPVPLHCPVTLTATLGNPVIHGETALRREPPRGSFGLLLSPALLGKVYEFLVREHIHFNAQSRLTWVLVAPFRICLITFSEIGICLSLPEVKLCL